MAILLSLEAYAGIFLDSICIGMFFTRFARANVGNEMFDSLFEPLCAVIEKSQHNHVHQLRNYPRNSWTLLLHVSDL